MYLWESYENLVDNCSCNLSGSEIDNYSPQFKRLYRDDEKKILLQVELRNYKQRNYKQQSNPTLGQVVTTTEYKDFTLKSNINSDIYLKKCLLIKRHYEPGKKLVETYKVTNIIGKCNNNIIQYTFDWVENIDSNNWPQVPPAARNNSCCATIIQSLYDHHNYLYMTGLCFKFANKTVYICLLCSKNNDRNRACIIYKGSFDENKKAKIRDCISFLLGRKLVYLGCSCFNDKFNLVNFKSVSSLGFNKAIYTLPTQPPIQLDEYGNGWHGYSDTEASAFIGKIYEYYDHYDLEHSFWIYWDALCLKSINSSILFSSAIEAVQNAYIRVNNSNSISGSIVCKNKWKDTQTELIAIIDRKYYSKAQKDTLKNKIRNLNQKPQSKKTTSFFNEIRLPFNTKEEEAYKHRNKLTHGSKLTAYDASTYQDIITNNKTLRMIFVKIILSITESSETYIDYSMTNHPVMSLR